MKLFGGLSGFLPGLLIIIMFWGCSDSNYVIVANKKTIAFYREDNIHLLTEERYIDTNNDFTIDCIRAEYLSHKAGMWMLAYYRLDSQRMVGGKTLIKPNPYDVEYSYYRNLPLYKSTESLKTPAFSLAFDLEKDGVWDFLTIDKDGNGFMEVLACRTNNCDSLYNYYKELNE